MKKIGFLSFGHWSRSPGSQTRTAADALQQSVELAATSEAAAWTSCGRTAGFRRWASAAVEIVCVAVGGGFDGDTATGMMSVARRVAVVRSFRRS